MAMTLREDFLASAEQDFAKIQQIQIIACGTSYHAGMIAKYWFEQLIDSAMPCRDCQRIPLSHAGDCE